MTSIATVARRSGSEPLPAGPSAPRPIRRLAYVTNARLPNERAHGLQISKMCEAFAGHGIELGLLHPRRGRASLAMEEDNLFSYYRVLPTFSLETLSSGTLTASRSWGLGSWVPGAAGPAVVFGGDFSWGLYAALAARRRKADVCFTRETENAFWLTRLGLPTIYEAHFVPRRAQRLLIRAMARSSSLRLTVALNSFIRDGLETMGLPPDRMIVEPNAVDLALYEELSGRDSCRQRLRLPTDRPIIGYVGRFQALGREKGIAALIQSMPHVRALRADEPLLLCVGGPMDAVPGYRELARALGLPDSCLRFVDRVPCWEVPQWIRACDVVTIPSPWNEHLAYFTSPLKLFEYMAAAATIVATDVPAIHEVLEHGRNSWLVAPGDCRELARGIEFLLANPQTAARLGRQARSDVEARSWAHRAGRILDALSRRR